MKESQTSSEWMREVQPEIRALDQIPLTGAAPPFDWAELSARLARVFERDGLVIKPVEMVWRSKDDLYEGIGMHALASTFSIPSMHGQVSLVLPIQEIESLGALFLTKDSHPPISMHEQPLIESFYRFFIVETLYQLNEVLSDKKMTPILSNQTSLPDQPALCWDISLEWNNHVLWGRLMISPELRRSWVDYFNTSHTPTPLSTNLAKTINVEVHVEVGKAFLSLAEWYTVKEGDC
jgi:flagellar motor switch protein FliN/FliY